MKKIFILLNLLVCFFFYSKSFSQHEWAPDSAVWNHQYSYSSWGPPFDYNRHNIETRVVGDSLYQGQVCRLLVRTLYWAGGGSVYYDSLFTYQDAFKVYFWNKYFNHFSLLYDFGVQVGDSVWLEGVDSICPAVSDFLIVDSVGTIVVNSDTLRYYVFESPSFADWGQFRRNIEKIGNEYTFLPDPSCVTDILGGHESPLYCYREPQIGLFSTGYAPTCEYILLGTEKDIPKTNLKIFTLENEWIVEGSFESRFSEIRLYTLAGKLEFQQAQNFPGEITIPKNNLSPGIYLFQANLISGERLSGKLLKQ